ncbi:hypothetical protein EJB05_14693, partial [Eragrostis curvula]
LGGQIVSPSFVALEHLEYLDLSGFYADDYPAPALTNSSAEFLGSMKNLRHLDLSGGILFSGSIPPQLANLSKLEYLDLSGASFSVGRVPAELGNLSNLRHLGLGNMHGIYSLDMSWLTRLHRLEYLDMSHVNLSTVHDWPQVLNTIPSLKVLNLASCLLPRTNQIMPKHLNLTKIVQLDLSFNHLGHPVASCWFWNVTTIESLELSATYLYGPFPTALGSLTSLRWFGFKYNANAATMPVELKSLCALEQLYLGGSLSQGNIKDLVDKLPHCNTRGTRTWAYNFTSSLFHLDLSNNHLTGVIPSDIANAIPSLFHLDLSGNNLTGPIPTMTGNSTSILVTLILRSNQLSGQIPKLPRSLTVLDASLNSLSGSLPSDFCAPNLQSIVLYSNYITGKIPGSICELQQLTTLDLSNNFLEGSFPQCSQMPDMAFFLLSGETRFAGVLSVVMKQQELNYGDRISEVAGIDLSLNHLTGGIPDEITSLDGMVTLNLSWNQLSGKIPENIGAMKFLESLDLSRNNLSGEIPPSLTDLTCLSYLGLSYNSLTGRIPSGRQLDTLCTEYPSMYDGNNGLCGPPLKRNCPRSKLPVRGNQKVSAELIFFYLGLGSGFTVGLWVVFCTLLFKKTWRIAYFRIVDKIYDRLYIFLVVTKYMTD